MFGKDKDETLKSPVDQLLSAFTEQAVKMNALLGFPGVLLLLAIVFAALPVLSIVNPAFTILAAASLVGSIATYLADWYYSLRHAEAQAQLVSDYTRLFLERYLASQEKVTAESVTFGIDHVLMPLLKKRQDALASNPKPTS